MKLLLDTHMLLWSAAGTLPKEAEKIVVDGNNVLYFSPASIWEIAIKQNLKREHFKVNLDLLLHGLLDNQYQELPITSLHTLAVSGLPLLHKDPFDRILLAQSKSEGITILTSDNKLREYQIPLIFIARK
jgi:PIN domain nuclease of toxin-antitoxin system